MFDRKHRNFLALLLFKRIVMMTEKNGKNDWIQRLKALFKTFRGKQPKPEETDYSRWQQTEEAYQKEQAEWLESVRRRKAEREQEKTDADRKGD